MDVPPELLEEAEALRADARSLVKLVLKLADIKGIQTGALLGGLAECIGEVLGDASGDDDRKKMVGIAFVVQLIIKHAGAEHLGLVKFLDVDEDESPELLRNHRRSRGN